MAKGKLFYMEIEDPGTPGSYIAIGGMRTNDFEINNEPVDTTSKDDTWASKESAGILSASLSGDGTFKDTAGEDALRDLMLNSEGEGNFRITNANGNTYTGPFIMTTLRFGSDHNGDVTYSTSLESSGPIVFAAS